MFCRTNVLKNFRKILIRQLKPSQCSNFRPNQELLPKRTWLHGRCFLIIFWNYFELFHRRDNSSFCCNYEKLAYHQVQNLGSLCSLIYKRKKTHVTFLKIKATQQRLRLSKQQNLITFLQLMQYISFHRKHITFCPILITFMK